MDPEQFENLIAAIVAAAVADGMPVDLKDLTFGFSGDGVSIRATPTEGDAYEGAMSAEQVAAALEMDASEPNADAEAQEPAQGEGG